MSWGSTAHDGVAGSDLEPMVEAIDDQMLDAVARVLDRDGLAGLSVTYRWDQQTTVRHMISLATAHLRPASHAETTETPRVLERPQ